jgi:hypothetical protein
MAATFEEFTKQYEAIEVMVNGLTSASIAGRAGVIIARGMPEKNEAVSDLRFPDPASTMKWIRDRVADRAIGSTSLR